MDLPASRLNADVAVAPQLGPAAMAAVAAAGFRSVINNRPDFEHGPDQPTNASIEAAARAAGLEYRFQPDSFEVRHVRAKGQVDVDLDMLLGKQPA